MSSSCRAVADELAKCIRASPCMAEGGKRDFHECLKGNEREITPECTRVRQLYFECKRAQLDMRKRFRGNPAF